MNRLILICMLLSSFLTGTTTIVDASGLSITVSPMSNEVTVDPGTQTTYTIFVKNDDPVKILTNTLPTKIKVYATDWSLDADGSPVFNPASTSASSCSGWIEVNPNEFEVNPGETRQVRLTVTVPASASGAYHTMAMFEGLPQRLSQNGPIAIAGRVGTALYVNVGPTVKRARFSEFTVESCQAKITLENTGTAVLRLKGKLTIKDASGATVEEVAIPSAVILPGADETRVISIDLPQEIKIEGDSAIALIDYGGDTLLGAKCSVAAQH